MEIVCSLNESLDEKIAEYGWNLFRNQYKEVNGHFLRGDNSDAVILAEKIDSINAESGLNDCGACVDVGVLNLCGQNPYEYISALSYRVKVVIVRENDGVHDGSLLPFTTVVDGRVQMDWLGVIRGLREIKFDGLLFFDFWDTTKVFSPLLRPQLLELAKSVADFFAWQIKVEEYLTSYKSIVLFGAGNMCRNYMKCYGEKYPPLFTCDNNPKLWDTKYCGLDVKSPKCLNELSEECVIMICNTHYFEIRKQLEDMGVKNEVVFFNDEYLPTYYFDRVER